MFVFVHFFLFPFHFILSTLNGGVHHFGNLYFFWVVVPPRCGSPWFLFFFYSLLHLHQKIIILAPNCFCRQVLSLSLCTICFRSQGSGQAEHKLRTGFPFQAIQSAAGGFPCCKVPLATLFPYFSSVEKFLSLCSSNWIFLQRSCSSRAL